MKRLKVRAQQEFRLIQLRNADDGGVHLTRVTQLGAEAEELQLEIEASVDQHSARRICQDAAGSRCYRVLDLVQVLEGSADADKRRQQFVASKAILRDQREPPFGRRRVGKQGRNPETRRPRDAGRDD